MLVDVSSHVDLVTPGTWERSAIPGIPPNTNTVLVDIDEYGDEMFLDSSGFDTPSQLLWGRAGTAVTAVKSAPAFFDASDIEVTQHFVASADGTKIPYFVVGHRSSDGGGGSTGPDRPCSAGTAGSRSPTRRVTPVCSAGCGWPAAAPTCWPTSAAAASTDRRGTRRRCARTDIWCTKTSPRWHRISSTAGSPPSPSSAPRAAATAAC